MSSKKDRSKEIYQQAQERFISTILSGDLEDPSAAFESVTEDDFEDTTVLPIFRIAKQLIAESSNLTIFSVARGLEAEGALERVGGIEKLREFAKKGQDYSLESPIEYYAKAVKEYSARLKLSEGLNEYIEELKIDSGSTFSDVASRAQADLNESLYSFSDDATITDMKDLEKGFLERLEERRELSEKNKESSGGLQGIPSSLPTLNEITGGWLSGQVITVGAQTAIGKSVFAINNAVAAAVAKKSVLFFSLEMGTEEIERRIVSSMSGVPMNAIKSGYINNMDRINETLEQLKEMKLTVDTETNLTIEKIQARALKQAQSKDGLDMVIVDYLQLLTPSSKGNENRERQVADISRGVKLLAKKLDVPIMIVVQLKRPNNDEDTERLPTNYDIRESGAIANDSDIILLLHRRQQTDEIIPKTQVIISKHRNGESQKIITCHSNLSCSVFREVTKEESTILTDQDLENLEDEVDSEFEDFDDTKDSFNDGELWENSSDNGGIWP